MATHPGRAPAAAGLLAELWSEYERLLRRVGEEVLSRALRQSSRTESAASVPAPAPTSPVLVTPPTVSEHDVRQWAARYRERPVPAPVSVAVVLHALLDRIGPPPVELGAEERELETDRLEQGTSEDTMREVRLLPNDVQRSYLRLLTARLNAVRAAVGSDLLMRERVGRTLGIIRDYTREHRPGAVYGLSRDHEPKGGSWGADAHHLWNRLARDDDDAPISRSAPVQSRRAEPEEEDEERESPGPEPEWPLWPFVRDRTVLMVGGAPRESARVRVERAFAMRELVWSADDPRKAQSAEARITSGGYDLVLVLLRFMSHATNEKLVQACSARDVPFVPVEHGYGVGSIRRSLERFLAPRAAGEAASR
ncbi:MAG TPA: hypothetical protein VN894_18485 [Polyangiaceae bacterium]|nr:hypothetical protein [Polyangiaceae bacterium]